MGRKAAGTVNCVTSARKRIVVTIHEPAEPEAEEPAKPEDLGETTASPSDRDTIVGGLHKAVIGRMISTELDMVCKTRSSQPNARADTGS